MWVYMNPDSNTTVLNKGFGLYEGQCTIIPKEFYIIWKPANLPCLDVRNFCLPPFLISQTTDNRNKKIVPDTSLG